MTSRLKKNILSLSLGDVQISGVESVSWGNHIFSYVLEDGSIHSTKYDEETWKDHCISMLAANGEVYTMETEDVWIDGGKV